MGTGCMASVISRGLRMGVQCLKEKRYWAFLVCFYLVSENEVRCWRNAPNLHFFIGCFVRVRGEKSYLRPHFTPQIWSREVNNYTTSRAGVELFALWYYLQDLLKLDPNSCRDPLSLCSPCCKKFVLLIVKTKSVRGNGLAMTALSSYNRTKHSLN